jgi:hypothetical protein
VLDELVATGESGLFGEDTEGARRGDEMHMGDARFFLQGAEHLDRE